MSRLWSNALGRTASVVDYNVAEYKIDPELDSQPWSPAPFVNSLFASPKPCMSSTVFDQSCKLLMVAADLNGLM